MNDNLAIEATDNIAGDASRRERGERGGERGEGARRERGGRRNERRPADDAAEGSAPVATDNNTATEPASADAAQDGQEPNRNNGGQRRSRDRYGRERRGRGDNAEAGNGDAPAAPTEGTDAPPAAATAEDPNDAPVRSYFTRSQAVDPAPVAPAEVAAEPPSQVAPQAEVPAAQPRAVPVEKAIVAPAVVPAVAEAGLPKVQPFTLEIDALAHIAQASGLVWVHSDSDKVQQAQAAIAAEPKPIHVPREPKPVVAVDDGPLVLVETRRDLRNLVLPFEQNNSAH